MAIAMSQSVNDRADIVTRCMGPFEGMMMMMMILPLLCEDVEERHRQANRNVYRHSLVKPRESFYSNAMCLGESCHSFATSDC